MRSPQLQARSGAGPREADLCMWSPPWTATTVLRLFAVVLAAVILPQALRGASGIPIERAQRELQARWCFVNASSELLSWPASSCKLAPAFPPDGFYGNLDKDTRLARDLVRDLAEQFYDSGLYLSFLATTDGVNWLPNHTPFTIYSQSCYDTTHDFPPSSVGLAGSGGLEWDTSGITTSNYGACLTNLLNYIESLSWMSQNLSYTDAAYWESDTADSTVSCDQAKAMASNLWGTGPWYGDSVYPPGVSSYTSANINGGVTTYGASGFSDRARFTTYWDGWSFPTNGTGTLNVFLIAETYSSGLGGNDPPVTPDGAYHLFTNAAVNFATNFDSGLIGGQAPIYEGACTGDTAGWYLAVPSQGGEPIRFATLKPDFNTDPDDVQPREGGCSSCQAGGNIPGTVIITGGSTGITIGLGLTQCGSSAGYFYLRPNLPRFGLFPVPNLLCAAGEGVALSGQMPSTVYGDWEEGPAGAVLYDGYPAIEGVPTSPGESWVDTGLVTAYIQASANGYVINFTDNATSSLVSSVALTQSGNPNAITITETLGDSLPRVISCNYNGTWTTLEGAGTSISSCSTVWTTSSNRIDTTTVLSTNGSIASQAVEYSQVFPWGRCLTQRIAGTGASAQTNTWTYYNDPVNDGGQYGQLQQTVGPTGRWETYAYDSTGRLIDKVTQLGSHPLGVPEGWNWETQISYSNDVIQTVEFLGNEVSRTYEVHAVDDADGVEQVQTIRCAQAGAAIGDPGNLTNILWRSTVDNLGIGLRAGDPWAELNPDGTMSVYSYRSQTRTVASGITGLSWSRMAGSGYGNWPAIIDGTATTTTTGDWGELLSRQVQDIASSTVLDFDQYRLWQRHPKTLLHCPAL